MSTICGSLGVSKMEISCPDSVVSGSLITKEARQAQHGRVAGGSGSTKIEKLQREHIVAGTGVSCDTTKYRINKRRKEMIEIAHPMKHEDGYDYTENFDGKQVFGNTIVWVNLKSVVGAGGSQTRTLRDECYPFVEAQLEYLLKSKNKNYVFANIFDGDQASSNMSKFQYLLDLPEYAEVKKYVYVGDLRGYFDWVKERVC